MAGIDLEAFFWVVAVAHVFIFVYIGYRILFKSPAPVERRFAPFPARASAMAVNLIRRPLRR